MPSSEDLSAVTGANNASTAATTVATPVLINGPLGNSALSFTPQSFDFGTLVQNSGAAEKSFTVTNTSTYTLILGAIAITNANFTLTANTCTDGLPMLSSATCGFTVRFAPTVSGNVSAAITIPYDVVSASNQFSSLLSVTGAGTSLVGFAGLDTINNQTPTSMRLNWTDVAGASTYQIYNTDSGTPVLLATVISENLVPGIGCGVGSTAGAGQCSYTATGLLPSTSHAYRVLASDFLGVQSINTHDVTSQTTADFLDLGGAASAAAGACTPMTVALTQADHSTPETVSADTTITIGGLGGGTIYSDNTCGTLIASPVVISNGTSSTTFYFKDNVAESLTLSATRSQFSSTTKALTVNPLAAIASVAYITAPATAYTASNSAPMTTFAVAIKDSFGNVITTNSTATITASRALGTGALSGTVTRTVSSGVATFNDVTYTKAETIAIKATENASGNGYNVTSASVTVHPAAITSIVWGTAPVTTCTASNTPMPTFTVELEDAFGNVVTSDNTSTVTLTRTGAGALGGTLTKTASNGVATFDDIIYTKAEPVTFAATESSANHYSVTKNVSVSPAAFSLSQSLLSSAASVYSGASITVTLTTKDAFGNSNPSGITSAGFTSSLVGGTGTFGSTTNAGAGVYTAAFTGVIAGSVTLGATINGGTVTSAPAPATVTVNPSPTIASVAFVAAPPATYTASNTTPMTAFTAAVKDPFGNVITSNSTAHVTLLGIGNTTLGGTLTKTVSNGVATFDDITYTKAETIQIKATEEASGSNLSVTSGSITVNPSSTIASVAFVAAPPATYTASNTTPMTAFTAAVKDPFGNVITTDNATTITAARATGTEALSGTLTRTASSGVAAFNDVTYTKPETITIQATENASTHGYSVTSSNITVTAHLAFATQPSSSGDTDTALSQQPVIAVQDGNGATASGATNSITLMAYSDSACTVPVTSALAAAANPLSAASGIATFSGTKILKTNVVRIGAGAAGITSACSSAITVAAGALNLSQSSVTWVPASLIADDSAASAVTVTLKDANGNGIPGKTVTATSARGADTISGSGGSTNSSGVAALTVKSSSTGSSTITLVGGGSPLPFAKLLFLAATPLTDHQSRLFDGVNPGDNSSSVKSVWKDLARSATTYDGLLTNFLFDATSGWSGAPPRSYSEEVLADNPVGYWRLGETSGTTANDISGTAINGTYTNVTLAQAGALAGDSNTAVSFNGTSSIVDLGQGATLKGVFDSGKKWTVSMWFKTAHLNGNGPWLFSKSFTSHTPPYYQFDIRQSADGSIVTSIWRGDTYAGGMTVSSPAIPTGTWTHLAVTVDLTDLSAASIKLYINGGTPLTSTANLTGIYTNHDSPVTLGANKNLTPGGYNFDGLIDEVAIFPSALSAARILAHYNAGAHPDHPLVFDGSTGNSYADFGTGVNGNANFSFETWLKPANTAATGKVILSNGTTTNPGTVSETNTGLTLRQSKIDPGKLELSLGEKSYSQEVLSDSPVGYWRLGETAGSTAYDFSGQGRNGTYVNGPTLGAPGGLSGDSDKAASFAAANHQYVNMGNVAAFNFSTAFTLEAWTNVTDGSDSAIIAKGYAPGYMLWNNGNMIKFYINGAIVIGTAITYGVWHHIVAVWDGSAAYIYNNGALATSVPYTSAPNSAAYEFYLGIYANPNQPLNGKIDEVAVYNTALSASRIAAHYNAASKRTNCTSTSTLADNIWHFISGVFDSTGPTLKLFVDGTRECSITNAGAAFTGSANPLRLGRDSGTANPWAGQVAELRTYSSALAAADVRNNMGATMSRFPTLDPKNIPGLKLWLKADTITGLADGAAVSSWSDSSGNGFNAVQATPANQPVFKSNILNGKPVVRGNGASYLTSVGVGTGWGTTAGTVFTVINLPSTTTQYGILQFDSAANTYGRYSGDGAGYWGPFRSARLQAQPADMPTSGAYVFTTSSGSANYNVRKNGVSVVSTTPSWGIPADLSLFIQVPALNGDIAEVILYNRELTATEIGQIEAYLNVKYGLY